MENVTIKQMIENSDIPASLIRAVIRQSGGFDCFKEKASDIYNHGIALVGGWIYYSETCAFYAKHRKDIIKVCSDDSSHVYGNDCMIDYIKSFNMLDATEEEIGLTLYGNKGQHDTQVANALTWFAAEEVYRLYCEMSEEN